MLLRISLVVAILAGLGGLYVGHFQVAQRIADMTTELTDTKNSLATAQGAEAKARGEAKTAKQEADKAKQELEVKTEILNTTSAQLAQQRKRADELFGRLTEAEKERNELRNDLSEWRSLGIAAKDIKELQQTASKVAKERDAFAGENTILLSQVKQLSAELARYTGTRRVEVALPTGLKGKVLAVDPKYDFVVLDIGGNQGVLKHGQMLVNRDGKLVGKVQITTVEPNRSIANVLPDWKQTDVMEGDQVLY
ncbi:MAG: hypothetical protein HY735_37530 [Verrucomicrobia bacterium]|nr:hypothetical protein [Verrucomicrobiota bacterium]